MSEDEINERLSRRFEGEEEPDRGSEQEAQKEQTSQKAGKAQNIKKEWNVRSFYLPDGLDDDLSTAFKRLDLDMSEDAEFEDLRKTRHFYPLVVALGLERLESMDVTEVTERLEGTEFQ